MNSSTVPSTGDAVEAFNNMAVAMGIVATAMHRVYDLFDGFEVVEFREFVKFIDIPVRYDRLRDTRLVDTRLLSVPRRTMFCNKRIYTKRKRRRQCTV